MSVREFEEIAHTGGEYAVEIKTETSGQRMVSVGYRHSRPTPASMFLLMALPQGIPFHVAPVGGLASPSRAPPAVRGVETVQVMIASDKHGLFGHACPRCGGYWRSDSTPARWPMCCPYCPFRSASHLFLTEGQKAFVNRFCEHYWETLEKPDGKYTLNLDKIADEVMKGAKAPNFFYAETSQQQQWRCQSCGSHNDILGKFGSCSCCGARNNFVLLAAELKTLKSEVKAKPAATLREAVSKFEAAGRDYIKAMREVVALSDKRGKRADALRFHDFERIQTEMKEIFDIDVAKGFKADEIELAKIMFLRRHVHEHNGGVADDKYLKQSGDGTVKLGQAIREKPEDVRAFIGVLDRMASNLDEGVLELLPPDDIALKVCAYRPNKRA